MPDPNASAYLPAIFSFNSGGWLQFSEVISATKGWLNPLCENNGHWNNCSASCDTKGNCTITVQ